MPLFVFEGDDLHVYPSVEDACGDLEAIDVRENVYEAFDSEGFEVELLTSGWLVVGAKVRESREPVLDLVTQRVRAYARSLAARELVRADVETSGLARLGSAILAIRPQPFSWREFIARRRKRK